MIRFVFLIWSAFIIAPIASNPVPALQCPIFQQSEFKNQQVNYRKDASQSNPYTQQATIQNQAPNRQLNDGSINQQFMNKILGNPCIQKLLDPNTKLYNLNGQEIQRQPKTGAAPNIINNYFIVPPEFFNFNNTQPVTKSKQVHKKRKVLASRKGNNAKSNVNVAESEEDHLISDKSETNKREKNNSRNKKGGKRNKNRKSAKLIAEDVELDMKSEPESETELKKTKKRRKLASSTTKQPTVVASSSIESKDLNLQKDEAVDSVNKNNKIKKRKQSKTLSKVIAEESNRSLDIEEPNEETQYNATAGMKTLTSSSIKTNEEEISETKSVEDTLHLKNIELPVDNSETKDLKENRDTKRNKDTRKTRNPKPERAKLAPTQKVTFEDMMRNLFPYMYMGNNFYSNGNYPLNLEQFYQPYANRNNKRGKKTKKKSNQNKRNNTESLPKVIKVKFESKKEDVTTTLTPLGLKNEDEVENDNKSIETTTQILTSITNNLLETPYKALSEHNAKDEFEIEIPKTESIISKANLEMPPTFIEDLHEYITPELGSEDIVPTIYTNGIINDYYPVFYDNSYYTNDDSYYLKDFEDDRDFYTTDRGYETQLNRDRRKYDKPKDFQRPNLNIKDRINFRRGKYPVRDRTKDVDDDKENYIQSPYTYKQIVEPETTSPKDQIIKEVNFQTPPSLENPDFLTKKVDKELLRSDVESHKQQEPIYTDSKDKLSDYQLFSDIKPEKFSRLINFNSDAEKEKAVPTTSKPRNDRIETVFAKTRVVKYGAAKETEENASTSITNENYNDDKFYSDGHTTFVVARSLGNVDDYW